MLRCGKYRLILSYSFGGIVSCKLHEGFQIILCYSEKECVGLIRFTVSFFFTTRFQVQYQKDFAYAPCDAMDRCVSIRHTEFPNGSLWAV